VWKWERLLPSASRPKTIPSEEVYSREAAVGAVPSVVLYILAPGVGHSKCAVKVLVKAPMYGIAYGLDTLAKIRIVFEAIGELAHSTSTVMALMVFIPTVLI
jgi:hypothetical protein